MTVLRRYCDSTVTVLYLIVSLGVSLDLLLYLLLFSLSLIFFSLLSLFSLLLFFTVCFKPIAQLFANFYGVLVGETSRNRCPSLGEKNGKCEIAMGAALPQSQCCGKCLVLLPSFQHCNWGKGACLIIFAFPVFFSQGWTPIYELFKGILTCWLDFLIFNLQLFAWFLFPASFALRVVSKQGQAKQRWTLAVKISLVGVICMMEQ